MVRDAWVGRMQRDKTGTCLGPFRDRGVIAKQAEQQNRSAATNIVARFAKFRENSDISPHRSFLLLRLLARQDAGLGTASRLALECGSVAAREKRPSRDS